jgi:hypothetical protein
MTIPQADQGSAERIAYLVLGMHRSGTSATAQVLALAGAHLPQNVMPGDRHNQQGYFEPWKIAMFNDRRLRAAGGAWDDVFAFPHRPLPRRNERKWLNEAAALFSEEYGEAGRPLLKDPRVTVLLPFWRTVLDDLEIAARCVISVRHPFAVAGSLARRDDFPVEKSLLVWSAYMLAAEAYTRDLPRVFLGYDQLLADWRSELARAEEVLGGGLPPLTKTADKAIDHALSADLRHNDGAPDLSPYGWAGKLTQQVWAWFADAAAGAVAAPDALTDAAAELDRRSREVGALISPLTRDLDAARAELLDLRQKAGFTRKQVQALDEERQALCLEIAALRDERAQAMDMLDYFLARS